MSFVLKTDLPVKTQQEIDRIQAIPTAQRSASEVAFLNALAPYLYNEVLERDADNLITKATGRSVPSGTGFKRGAIYILEISATQTLYVNVGNEDAANWKLLSSDTTTTTGEPTTTTEPQTTTTTEAPTTTT